MEVIVSHSGADFDAYASMVAAQRLYPDAKLVTLGPPAPWVRSFLSLHQGEFPVVSAKHIKPDEVTRMIMVDTSNPNRLGPLRFLVQQSGVEVHIFDHHAPTAESVKGEMSRVELLGAAVTVVLEEVLRQKPFTRLSVPEATLFLIAIYEETGGFTFPSTTARDMRMAAWLMEQGARLSVVTDVIQRDLNNEQRDLRDMLLKHAEPLRVGDAQVLLLPGQIDRYVGELNEVVARVLQQEPVDIVLAAVSMGGRLYLIGRSRDPRFNLQPAFVALGGGGHPCAASANLAAQEPRAVLQQVLDRLQIAPARPPLVRDHMSQQVHTLDLTGQSVVQALRQMRALGRTAMVVTRDGEPVGMLARSDLDKAMHHGLQDMAAESVMTKPIISVQPDMTLDEVRELLIRHDVGRLPVLEDGKLIGIISRTDVLRQIYLSRDSHRESEDNQTNLHDLLLQLPWEWLDLLKLAGRIANGCGVEAYAVGGFVRDLLLRRLHEGTWDLDLCIEGSVDLFLERMADRVKAEVHRHKRFETATLILPSGTKIDVARARQERYVRPAALPEVESSNLKHDLFRRDFTINALAVRLTEGNFGELVDFFGGLGDLRGKAIRVLHNHSFIDDPTRILRAVRLEQRLGFHVRGSTEHLMRSAVQQGVLPLAGPDRIRDELVLCLSEKHPVATLERLNKLRVLHSVHPNLGIDQKVRRVLIATEGAVKELGPLLPDLKPWRAYMRTLLHRWKEEPLKELLRSFHFHLDSTRAAPPMPQVLWRLSRDGVSPSQLYQLLEPLAADELTLLWALTADTELDRERIQRRMLRYLNELRHKKPLLNGQQILDAGVPRGPQVAAWKARAFDHQLDEGWTEPEQAVRWLHGELLPVT
jgi:tRNA nucleotidyltransferase (CCA-adding enzyme)